jgi:hypothetical protein
VLCITTKKSWSKSGSKLGVGNGVKIGLDIGVISGGCVLGHVHCLKRQRVTALLKTLMGISF